MEKITEYLKPNTKYGFDKSITLRLRGVTYGDCKPFNVDLKNAKITTDTNGTPCIEAWDEAIILDDEDNIREVLNHPNDDYNLGKYMSNDKKIYNLYITE